MLDSQKEDGNNQDAVSGQSQTPAAPTISLPKGGGAIRGIGEKFAANPVTGTGSMTVPIATSPGRSGFGPQLSLAYDSGAGNGPFGFGWSLSTPNITRKTDKGLPQYLDVEESGVFILSGAEDLVPILVEVNGEWQPETLLPRVLAGKTYQIHRYRPRIEGLFARIERWTDQATGEIHWRSISRDNITTLYGKTPASRIADPADPQRIFSWLICASYDDKGNAIVYQYAAENDEAVNQSQANERNRLRTANRYLKRIKYGNRSPNRDDNWQATDPAALPDDTWMFEAVFDYNEEHYEALDLDSNRPEAEHRYVRVSAAPNLPWDAPQRAWTVRPDPFSTYRAGFEVRTYRRCCRVLMFHRFAELGSEPYLVRSTEFDYADLDYSQPTPIETELVHQGSTRIGSFIRRVTQAGFMRDDSQPVVDRNGVKYATYLKKSLPPLEFEYSRAIIQEDVRDVEAESLENLPVGLDGAGYQWVDLDGEGVSGILTEQADGWFYKRNLSPNHQVTENGQAHPAARFGPVEMVTTKPAPGLAGGQMQFLDLAGDGQVDLVQMAGSVRGFYERTDDAGWVPFRAFVAWPNLDPRDPNLKFVDLTGDGHADMLLTEDQALTWHVSLAEAGFGPARRVYQSLDEEFGPRLVFADGTESVYLADMCGDGLTDLVRIRNGEVCYWPNLGYGRFGAKVTMDASPWFDSEEQFNQQRLRLADIDGSGTNDIIYLGRNGVRLFFNQAGNRWSEPYRLGQFPAVDNIAAVMTADLLGNGTACLVWSSPLPGETRRPMRYLDLMGGQKPHLLVKTINNLGAETQVHYAPSSKFYLDDKEAGTPWITRLPFPVHVVERVETYDRISRNRFVTRYAYHHGYFDGEEREFRGFGMVEQWDTDEFKKLDQTAANVDASWHVPPVHTKSWFHTGAYARGAEISRHLAREYFGAPQDAAAFETWAKDNLLDDTVWPDVELSADEIRQACRALKGAMLRQEVYADDGSTRAGIPYTVTEQNFTLVRLQPQAGNRHAVFFTHAREAITFHYERNPADPRVQHALTLEIDPFGNVLKSAAIGYGRRIDAPDTAFLPEDHEKQRLIHITCTENAVTNPIVDSADVYRTPLPAETRTYEVRKPQQEKSGNKLTKLYRFEPLLNHLNQAGDGKHDIEYEDILFGKAKQAAVNDADEGKKYFRRLIEQARTLYRPDDLGAAQNDPNALLPLGEVEPLALPGESYKLAFTPGLLDQVYVRGGQNLLPANPADVLKGVGADQGGYVDFDSDGHWWIPAGRVFLSPDSTHDAARELAFARSHFFLPHRYRDPFGIETTVTYDSDPNDPTQNHNLLPVETKDPFGNVITVKTPDDNGDTEIRIDYRLLQPYWATDPNGNRTRVAFDALGMVVATAVMGKSGEKLGDLLEDFDADPSLAGLQAFIADPQGQASSLLGKATTRIVYDLGRYARAGQPPFASTLARETHVHDSGGAQTNIQISFSYSDGFGREIQQKIQAEAGDAPQRQANVPLPTGDILPGDLVRDPQGQPVQAKTPRRWVGSGRMVFNNKGKPVRQYEPFFSATHLYEPEREMTDTGVSPILFYDPVERVVATLHPNHTYEKVVFDPWWQTTYDVNDTVAANGVETDNPRNDADIQGYVAEYFKTQPSTWQTWYKERITGAKGAPEKSTAEKAAQHANTPTTAHLDALGRPFLTFADNGPDPAQPDQHLLFATRVELDIEGNPRAVIDAKGRVVMRYDYDLLGNRIHQASMEAGRRWMLNDVTGKPIYAWDSRGFMRRLRYDELRRPTDLFVTENSVERLAERTVYGESQGDTNNHRTQVYQLFDGAGVVTNELYDFKGNLRQSKRELLPNYQQAVDWLQSPSANDGTFTTSTEYDALNRPTAVTAPDNSVYRSTFNEANLLDKVAVNLRGAATATPFVTNINYNPKGQRELIVYGNGAQTTYKYDELTFHLTNLKTIRPAGLNGLAAQIFADPAVVQDLRYTYDPAGNITSIDDAALKTIRHNRQKVEPVCSYTYDAIYRLIEARGREHIGQTAHDFNPPNDNRRDYPFVGLRAHPNDPQALRNYTESYEYDAIGNFQFMHHTATNGSWTRVYTYNEGSLLETGKQNNRLTHTQVGNGSKISETYSYSDAQGNDIHGCMTAINSMMMIWDFEDQLQQVDLGGGGTAYYVYDAAGQRVRKVIHRQNGTKQKERLYLGGFEIYREYNGSGATTPVLERETLHLMDDQQRLALVETKTIDTQSPGSSPQSLTRYQFSNHLGSASLELDDQAQIISYEEYTPYGSTSYQAVRSQTETPKHYRYTGKERDEESGLYYHGARYYASWLGRWVSPDPRQLVDGINLYQFTRMNPIRYIDPNGTNTLPKIEPIREGMIVGDYPGLSSRGKQAVEGVLERQYAGGSYEKNMTLFREKLQSLPGGSNNEPGTAINLARGLFDKARKAFGRRVPLPAGTQVHHAFEGESLAENPAAALDLSHWEITSGRATDPTSTHGRAHQATRLQGQGVKNPGVQATQQMQAARMSKGGATPNSNTLTTPAELPPALPVEPAMETLSAAQKVLTEAKAGASAALKFAREWGPKVLTKTKAGVSATLKFAGEWGPKALRVLGAATVVYGAWNQADKAYEQATPNIFNKEATAILTFFTGIAAGAVDDVAVGRDIAFTGGGCYTQVVLDTYMRENGSPLQVAARNFWVYISQF